MLNQQLLLVQFLLAEFGFRDFADLRKSFSEYELRSDESESSLIFQNLMVRPGRVVPPTLLQQYDENLIRHLAHINEGRSAPISLKYYQYFSALFAEHYLNQYYADKADWLARLNRFRQQSPNRELRKVPAFVADELNKLAFWNATGSGKTYLLHLNILQVRHYIRLYTLPIKNLILLTPSEELSQQHLREMAQSNLLATPYAEDKDGPGVKVIELSKLKLEKTFSGGVTIPVAEFEEQNALFVDEGHKGSKTEDSVWREVRNRISRQGFAFEYSATFGQITDRDLLAEYSRCIAFDYSYGRFYADGYGKSYWIHNLTDNDLTGETVKRQYLLQNLLLFAQQKLHYYRQPEQMQTYQLENPLLVFVGSSVVPKTSASTSEKRENEDVISDVKTVLDFFLDFTTNRGQYVSWITALRNNGGLFPGDYRSRLDYLLNEFPTDAEVYNLIISRVFNAPSAEPLELYTLRNNNAEIGLRLRGSDHYFGLIYIGDVSTFKSSLGEGYEIKRDVVISQSLFGALSDQSSNPINLLIGARKFIEGWNNFRVSGIGLINFGRAKGAQIIQLFGRGVRLRGKDGSLKRSQGQPDAPNTIHINETLNIFGLRADYMRRFNEDLHKEGISTTVETITFPTVITHDLAKLQLLTLQRNESIPAFHTQPVFMLEADSTMTAISLDFASKRFSAVGNAVRQTTSIGRPFSLHPFAGWVDWSLIYRQLQQVRREKQYTNLHIQRESLPSLFANIRHQVIADEELQIQSVASIDRLQKLTFSLCKKYMENFYKRRLRAYEGRYLQTAVLDETNGNLNGLSWSVEVMTTDALGNELAGIDLTLKRINNLLAQPGYPSRMETDATLKNGWLEAHLYQPLLADESQQQALTANSIPVVERVTPAGLNKGELRFIDHLRLFIGNKDTNGYSDYDFYLLRNLSRGKGFGFYFEASGGFFPDFMLWIKEKTGTKQYLTFIDPHGLRNEEHAWSSDKIQLYQKLTELQTEIGNADLRLNSFILDPNGDLQAAGLDRWQRPGNESLQEYAAQNHVYEIPISGNVSSKGGYIDKIVKAILN
ncbi:DEAD/DEAH box helicase family protein [Spirosoma sp. KUDC1026]|uniref:DEAD/DEAH box helicase family protein n=1 Tax=Spirosoma sp. KUDC1026 TaxID=2745947 RepID=UPI00159BA54A|nr:DEAD/DEAH box helicase family protein [Spirosoma sp. KUDC1026]QKZ12664.1 DEAD/DEAH box helicase family protein [Spirosoma sp. KUDC1026]